jgi:hypothetical protein
VGKIQIQFICFSGDLANDGRVLRPEGTIQNVFFVLHDLDSDSVFAWWQAPAIGATHQKRAVLSIE